MPYDFTTWDRNCNVEQPTEIQGNTTGTIPAWLHGSLLLNGPGIQKYGDQEFNHVFDGSAVIQKFKFYETGVTYMNKFLRSYAFTANSEHKQVVVSEFGTVGSSVAKGKLQKLGDKFSFERMFSDNAPVAIVKIFGNYFATTESPFLHQIDPDTLDTVIKYDLHKDLGINSQSPHPWELPDGTTINVLHAVGATGPRYDIVQFPATNTKEKHIGKPNKIGSIDARWKLNPCHMHSFGVTESYIVLFEQPLTIDVKAMVTNTMYDRPFIGGMEWKKDKMVKYHLLNRSTGKKLKYRFKSDAFFYLHIINSYEQDGHVIVDVTVFDKTDVLHALLIKTIRDNMGSLNDKMDKGKVIRVVLPTMVPDKSPPEQNLITLAGSKAEAYLQKDGVVIIKPETISDTSYENPTIHKKHCSFPYRYFYGASGDLDFDYGLVGKIDNLTKEVKTWNEPNFFPTTSTFIPRPGAHDEDDGVILVNGLYGGSSKKNSTKLIILNAKDMTEMAGVEFNLPCDAPRALHATYVD